MIRTTIPSILASSLLLALTVTPDASAQRGRGRSKEPTLEHFTSRLGSFESESIGREAEYRVYLPEGYDEEEEAETRYPLVLWLHGMWEDHNRFHTRGGAEVLDRMRGDEEIPELVLVCCNATKASFYINGVAEKSGYEDLVATDLIAHVEETYRVSEETRERAICGVSMGGYGALKIAFHHPDRFGVVAAHSAAILPADPNDLEKEFPWIQRFQGAAAALRAMFGEGEEMRKNWDAQNLLEIAATVDPDALADLKIYFDCGNADRYGFFAPNERLHELLEKRGIRHTWRQVDGGDHGWRRGYNAEALPHALAFVTAAFTASRAVSGLGGLFGGQEEAPPAPDSSGRKSP